MLRVAIAVALLAFTVFCVVDAVQTEKYEVRGLPKPLWVVLCLILPVVGGLAWFVFGRPRSILDILLGEGRGRSGPPHGPDDDPDFLRDL
ncbi:putative membrane protein [Serinicoccus hydrothermalis]|uniref:Putative membrane protein n=1 Tax=Serinicoccus hydrothermalis TaxID=1758689 RepID=A0A1B1NBM5_9MICO|nr:PLD nuclease N-terminal domain-containing protein [Serinicoccus hydrothermalis]ANS78811.1 putative membrane protein [Serinicoccus hydrothermalis]